MFDLTLANPGDTPSRPVKVPSEQAGAAQVARGTLSPKKEEFRKKHASIFDE